MEVVALRRKGPAPETRPPTRPSASRFARARVAAREHGANGQQTPAMTSRQHQPRAGRRRPRCPPSAGAKEVADEAAGRAQATHKRRPPGPAPGPLGSGMQQPATRAARWAGRDGLEGTHWLALSSQPRCPPRTVDVPGQVACPEAAQSRGPPSASHAPGCPSPPPTTGVAAKAGGSAGRGPRLAARWRTRDVAGGAQRGGGAG